MVLTEVSGIVFDLDGTLLDTLSGHGGSFNRALETLGFPVHDIDAYRYFIGNGAAVCAQRALPAKHSTDKKLVDSCVRLFKEDYAATWQTGTLPYPGIPEMLERFMTAAVPLAVLSNKDDEFTQQMVKESFPDIRFRCIAGYDHAGQVRHKPDPSGPLFISRRMGISLHELAMVGDTATDMNTATSSGMLPVGVLWGFRSRDELLNGGARWLLESPVELNRLIKSQEAR